MIFKFFKVGAKNYMTYYYFFYCFGDKVKLMDFTDLINTFF